MYCVLDYGVVADGVTLCTASVQRLVDEVSQSGGGTIIFPSGNYVLSTVFLKSNVTIRLEEGAKLLGSLNFYDYAQQEPIGYPIYQDASHTYFDLSMFVGKHCENIAITGKGIIDMRSIWDEDGVRGTEIRNRGPKCIALRKCKNVTLSDFGIYNATDLAIYFAGCENVEIYGLSLQVYIDGISPDNSKNVKIHGCTIESGDDGLVFKSSYTLNRLDICKDISVWNCKIRSRCSAIKFGTETNGGFENIYIDNISISDTRITGIAIESVDGAVIDGITIKNIKMRNVNAPLFIHLGNRMRGPEGREVGTIQNILLENITAEGPYTSYHIMPSCYPAYKEAAYRQYPWVFSAVSHDQKAIETGMNKPWQWSSNICGLREKPLKNITLRNISLKLDGGVTAYEKEVPDIAPPYPEVNVYGEILPSKGIYFRYVESLVMDHVTVKTYRYDAREDFVFEHVTRKDEGRQAVQTALTDKSVF